MSADFTERMDQLAAISRPFTLISPGEVRELIRTCERAEAFGPVLVPTEFRAGAGRLADNVRFLRAVAAFMAELEAMRPRSDRSLDEETILAW